MRTLYITLFVLSIINFCSSQQAEIINFQTREGLTKTIQLNDSLLLKYQTKSFLLSISNDSTPTRTKTLKHFLEFYESEIVFNFDSIHAKKQINVLKTIIDKEIERLLKIEKNMYSYDSQLKKILNASKNALENEEIVKSLELLRRYFLIKPE